jgi:hypothetical protein
MHQLSSVARFLALAGLVTFPVVAILNRMTVQTETLPSVPWSLRLPFYTKASELTERGQRARLGFRIYWLCLAGILIATLARDALP